MHVLPSVVQTPPNHFFFLFGTGFGAQPTATCHHPSRTPRRRAKIQRPPSPSVCGSTHAIFISNIYRERARGGKDALRIFISKLLRRVASEGEKATPQTSTAKADESWAAVEADPPATKKTRSGAATAAAAVVRRAQQIWDTRMNQGDHLRADETLRYDPLKPAEDVNASVCVCVLCGSCFRDGPSPAHKPHP